RSSASFRSCSRSARTPKWSLPQIPSDELGLPASLHHFESEVGGARCLDRTEPPQFDPLRIETLEEPDAAAEEYGGQVDLHFVQQAGLQILPHDVRSAPDTDVLVAGGSTGKLECSL